MAKERAKKSVGVPHVALLRGVNVNGVTVKMVELAKLVAGLGYGGVRTILASGNVVFSSTVPAAAAKSALEAALRKRFGYEAWVQVLPIAEIRKIVEAYPFKRDREGWHDYVSFVVEKTTRADLLAVAKGLDAARESAAGGDGVIYWTVERSQTLECAMGKAQGKAKYKPWLTTRNIRTLDKVIAAGEA